MYDLWNGIQKPGDICQSLLMVFVLVLLTQRAQSESNINNIKYLDKFVEIFEIDMIW